MDEEPYEDEEDQEHLAYQEDGSCGLAEDEDDEHNDAATLLLDQAH